MKIAFAILTMSVAGLLAGCTTNNSPGVFTADFWERDPNAVAANDQYVRHDKRPTTQNIHNNNVGGYGVGGNAVAGYYDADGVWRDGGVSAGYYDDRGIYHERHDVTVSGPRRPVGVPNDATSGTVMNDTQLQHGNDKTRIGVALNTQDQQFILDAAGGGLYEVQSSQKALTKSSDNRIRTFAQMMIDDHTKANNALMALAQRKGVPTASLVPNADQVAMLARLDSLNGTDFDREFMEQQRKAHLDSIAKFQAQANNGFDRDLRDFAASTLPTLRTHLDMINGTPGTNLGNER